MQQNSRIAPYVYMKFRYPSNCLGFLVELILLHVAESCISIPTIYTNSSPPQVRKDQNTILEPCLLLSPRDNLLIFLLLL